MWMRSNAFLVSGAKTTMVVPKKSYEFCGGMGVMVLCLKTGMLCLSIQQHEVEKFQQHEVSAGLSLF